MKSCIFKFFIINSSLKCLKILFMIIVIKFYKEVLMLLRINEFFISNSFTDRHFSRRGNIFEVSFFKLLLHDTFIHNFLYVFSSWGILLFLLTQEQVIVKRINVFLLFLNISNFLNFIELLIKEKSANFFAKINFNKLKVFRVW